LKFRPHFGSWSLEIPSDWELVASEWEPGFTAHRAQATLRVMQFLWDNPANAAAHRKKVAELNRAQGRSAVDVDYGTFSGLLIEVEDGDLWCRCWTLASAGTELEVTYGCPRAHAGEDDPSLDEMLRTLRIGAGAA
jgi:hypothetical protein